MTTLEFGTVCGKVGVVIALASIIGVCIMESGAADKVVRRFIAAFGERRAGLALVTSGFLLGLPIFFDTFFMLLIPLARALRLRTGKDYTLFVLAICTAGAVTHSLVAPASGAARDGGVAESGPRVVGHRGGAGFHSAGDVWLASVQMA